MDIADLSRAGETGIYRYKYVYCLANPALHYCCLPLNEFHLVQSPLQISDAFHAYKQG